MSKKARLNKKITDLSTKGIISPWEQFYLQRLIHTDMDQEDKAIDYKMTSDALIGVSDLISIAEAAEILGVTRQRIHDRIKRGSLTVVQTVGPQGMQLLDRKQVDLIKKVKRRNRT